MKRLINIILEYTGIFFLTVFCCISCKQTVREELHILIQNRTNDTVHVTLFPKEDIGGLYPVCFGCGGHKLTKFDIYPITFYDYDNVIFTTHDLDINPYILASKAFDSIHISFANKEDVIIKFAHESVTGYSENIFTENSTWYFEIVEGEEPTQFRKNPCIYHWYVFEILEDKIIF